ncbi:hypothetical protein RQ359_001052 [Sulfuracidifex metallicus DSM 6482 = JCM 9184]|uniref:Uncharacterized protein n=2 Tax=Sulfuracidifex metallicus TaxID=47303 RepID=A0A6A9QNJ9_SULME|nr:hypothetical protein [Sulfuracidifex metallicus DSM 6482 = JCM 9184]WOE51724.1 hypothetical protein RQ359_001052 [Sulfuracidifex metallicus DSM 6482 = JCM 9184]
MDSFNTVKGDPKSALSNILKAMDLKSKEMKEIQIYTDNDIRKVFDSVFYARKYRDQIIDTVGVAKFSQAFSKLQDSSLPYEERVLAIESLLSSQEAKEDLRDMARELIHFMEPENYPLWTRWIWNKERGTGSITYVLKEGLKLEKDEDFFAAVKELKDTLSVFGLDVPNYFGTSIFLVYAYVRYVDYATLLAVDRKAGGLYPSHLSTTALVLGLKSYLKVIQVANSKS